MGSIIKRGPRNAPKFYGKYRDENKAQRMKLLRGATSMEHARKLLANIERNIMEGRVGIEEPTDDEIARRRLTVRELGEKFLDEKDGYSNPKVKDMKLYRRSARWKLDSRIYPRLGDRAVASLDVTDLERFRDELLAATTSRKWRPSRARSTLAPASVTRTLALLSKMFAWGRKVGLISGESPTRGCVRPPASSSLDYLSREEVAGLLQLARAHAEAFCTPLEARTRAVMVATAIYTGMRKGELFGLRWSDVRLEQAQLDVARSYARAPKSGKARHPPIHHELIGILRAWKEQTKGTPNPLNLVFPVDEGRGPRMGVERDTLSLAELMSVAVGRVPEHPWHALRHTFASHFMMAGGNILTLQKLLGHSTLAMTMVYAHLSPDHLKAELARMTFETPIAGVTSLTDEKRRREAASTPYTTGIPTSTGEGSASE